MSYSRDYFQEITTPFEKENSNSGEQFKGVVNVHEKNICRPKHKRKSPTAR